MKRKPIKLEWDELDSAFSNQNEELVYYLDRVTGYVILEGEGEGDDYDDEEAAMGGASAQAPVDSTRLLIRPVDDDLKLEWVLRFVDEVDDLEPEFVSALKQALTEDSAVEGITEVLRQNPDGRDRWYVYRSDRKHEMIDAWLEEHEIVSVDPPPWKAD